MLNIHLVYLHGSNSPHPHTLVVVVVVELCNKRNWLWYDSGRSGAEGVATAGLEVNFCWGIHQSCLLIYCDFDKRQTLVNDIN